MTDRYGLGCMLTRHVCPHPDECGCLCHKQETESHMKHSSEERVGRYLSLLAIPQSRLKAWRKLGRVMGVPHLRAAWRRGEIERTELVTAVCAVINVEFDLLERHDDEAKDPIMVALKKLEAL